MVAPWYCRFMFLAGQFLKSASSVSEARFLRLDDDGPSIYICSMQNPRMILDDSRVILHIPRYSEEPRRHDLEPFVQSSPTGTTAMIPWGVTTSVSMEYHPLLGPRSASLVIEGIQLEVRIPAEFRLSTRYFKDLFDFLFVCNGRVTSYDLMPDMEHLACKEIGGGFEISGTPTKELTEDRLEVLHQHYHALRFEGGKVIYKFLLDDIVSFRIESRTHHDAYVVLRTRSGSYGFSFKKSVID